MDPRLVRRSARILTLGLVILGLGVTGMGLAAGTALIPLGGLVAAIGFAMVIVGANQLATNVDVIAHAVARIELDDRPGPPEA